MEAKEFDKVVDYECLTVFKCELYGYAGIQEFIRTQYPDFKVHSERDREYSIYVSAISGIGGDDESLQKYRLLEQIINENECLIENLDIILGHIAAKYLMPVGHYLISTLY
jgi:hypothetical protein